VVFAADGAGAFLNSSESLRHELARERVPLHVERVAWSHGYLRVLADQVDYGHARDQGRRLAEAVLALRQVRPDLEIYFYAHSAGAAVVLAAAEHLPPGCVDRIILLAPAVSSGYDLRRALCSTSAGIDVFYSRRDWAFLSLGVTLFGTADRRWCAAAGRVGFRPRVECPADSCLYHKLRQHAWCPAAACTGHHGGHSGAYQPGFLRACVVPLLQR
jgi:pimeloyl-ACP methyl ester carboxylesterase